MTERDKGIITTTYTSKLRQHREHLAEMDTIAEIFERLSIDSLIPQGVEVPELEVPAPPAPPSPQAPPAVIRKHPGGIEKGVPARALELAFQHGRARRMTQGTLAEWAEAIKGTGTLFTTPDTKTELEYKESLQCKDYRSIISKRFARALKAVGKKLLRDTFSGQNSQN